MTEEKTIDKFQTEKLHSERLIIRRATLEEEIERTVNVYEHYGRYSKIPFLIPIRYPEFSATEQRQIIDNWDTKKPEQISKVRKRIETEYTQNENEYTQHEYLIQGRVRLLGNTSTLINQIHQACGFEDTKESIELIITNYGAAGSAYPKDKNIKLRMRDDYDQPKRIEHTIPHELVHLIVENEIDISGLTHNEKECLMEVITMKVLGLSRKEYSINAASRKVFEQLGQVVYDDLFGKEKISIIEVVDRIPTLR